MISSCTKKSCTLFSRFFSTKAELEAKLKEVLTKKDRFSHLSVEYDNLLLWLDDSQKLYPSEENLKIMDKVRLEKENALKIVHDAEIEEADINKQLKDIVVK